MNIEHPCIAVWFTIKTRNLTRSTTNTCRECLLLTVAPLSVLLPWIPRTSWASHEFFNAPNWSTSYQGIVLTGLTEGFINRLTACVVANTHELAEIINSFFMFRKNTSLKFYWILWDVKSTATSNKKSSYLLYIIVHIKTNDCFFLISHFLEELDNYMDIEVVGSHGDPVQGGRERREQRWSSGGGL